MPAKRIERSYKVMNEDGFEIDVHIEKSLDPFEFALYGYGVSVENGTRHFFKEKSFEDAFRIFCSEYNLQPVEHHRTSDQSEDKIQKEGVTSEKITNPQSLPRTKAYSAEGVNKIETSSPADYLKTLEVLHDLLKKNVISRDEFDVLKGKIITFFPER